MDINSDNRLKRRDQEPHRVPDKNESPAQKDPDTKKDSPVEEPKEDPSV